MLSQQLIDELRQIIKEDYKLDLPLSEAKDIANTLLGYFDTLLEIEYENDHEISNQ